MPFNPQATDLEIILFKQLKTDHKELLQKSEFMGLLREDKATGLPQVKVQRDENHQSLLESQIPDKEEALVDPRFVFPEYWEPQEEGWKVNSKGHRYRGEFEEGLRHGKGAIEYPDGTRYKGEFERDLKNGEGELVFADGTTYKGAFKNGRYHGFGRYSLNSQFEYSGQFLLGLMHGKGALTNPSGEKFAGAFHRGSPHGEGVLSLKQGGRVNLRFEEGVLIEIREN